MLDDVRKDVADARAKLLDHVRELPALREALLDARETLTWCAALRSRLRRSASRPPPRSASARQSSRRSKHAPGSNTPRCSQALEADAAALAQVFSAQQKQQLGIAELGTPLDQAMWDADVDPAWRREQLERARQLAPWSRNPQQLRDEARDFRP